MVTSPASSSTSSTSLIGYNLVEAKRSGLSNGALKLELLGLGSIVLRSMSELVESIDIDISSLLLNLRECEVISGRDSTLLPMAMVGS
jgi:hypothetical protein